MRILTDPADIEELKSFLSKYKLMSVGTYNHLPWAASVYYTFDESFNLYFVSNPQTRHCLNITKNPNVSVTIADSNQNPTGKKAGFQARGIATKVTSLNELKEIIKAWNKRGFVPITYKLLTKAWKSNFFKIKLTEVQLFDENQPEIQEKRNWKI